MPFAALLSKCTFPNKHEASAYLAKIYSDMVMASKRWLSVAKPHLGALAADVRAQSAALQASHPSIQWAICSQRGGGRPRQLWMGSA